MRSLVAVRRARDADRDAGREDGMRMPEPDLQRQVDKEKEEKLLQTKPLVQRRVRGRESYTEVPPIVHEVMRSPGQPLDSSNRNFMEPRFGNDFSQIRIHTDRKAAESARAVNALAYTVGQNIVFGAGQYATGTMAGRQLLAHELVHTIQQRNSGRHMSLTLG